MIRTISIWFQDFSNHIYDHILCVGQDIGFAKTVNYPVPEYNGQAREGLVAPLCGVDCLYHIKLAFDDDVSV